jgi:hypothetical protein
MMALDVLGRGEEPPNGPLTDVFRVEYRKRGKELGFLSIAKNTRGEFFGRTEYSAGWIRLHTAFDSLANEAVKVASGT